MDEETLIREYSKHFHKKFQFSLNRNQFCFIDNAVDEEGSNATVEEKQKFEEALD